MNIPVHSWRGVLHGCGVQTTGPLRPIPLDTNHTHTQKNTQTYTRTQHRTHKHTKHAGALIHARMHPPTHPPAHDTKHNHTKRETCNMKMARPSAAPPPRPSVRSAMRCPTGSGEGCIEIVELNTKETFHAGGMLARNPPPRLTDTSPPNKVPHLELGDK